MVFTKICFIPVVSLPTRASLLSFDFQLNCVFESKHLNTYCFLYFVRIQNNHIHSNLYIFIRHDISRTTHTHYLKDDIFIILCIKVSCDILVLINVQILHLVCGIIHHIFLQLILLFTLHKLETCKIYKPTETQLFSV